MKTTTCRTKLVLHILLAVLIVGCTALVYIHRRAIRAAIKGDPLPACPHWLPKKLKEKLGV